MQRQGIQESQCRRCPDGLIPCGDYNVIVEVDEDQHNTEAYCSCEEVRTSELWLAPGEKRLVMLRFNPDWYINDQWQRVDGMFT